MPHTPLPPHPSPRTHRLAALGAAAIALAAPPTLAQPGDDFAPGTHVVLSTNDLGMHCMQQDFSDFMILPPYNTVHAQVLRRGEEPSIISSGITVSYFLGSNTRSSDKTNFWNFANGLFGVNLAPDTGLTGNKLNGFMTATANRDWAVTGIPITPINDDGREDPYPLATITVVRNSAIVAQTQAVVPVSWEIGCNLCHGGNGESVGHSVLRIHDELHHTNLLANRPVNCSSCHADPAVGSGGQPGISFFSTAMHGAHADRLFNPGAVNTCYYCHPGNRTQCQRDVHAARGMSCTDCHGGMAQVGSPTRTPWVDVPKCGSCHTRPGFEFEQPGKLFRESVGHGGVTCLACHGSPHAVGPAVTAIDNHQSMIQQDVTGPIRTCTVCHTTQPSDSFFHRRED